MKLLIINTTKFGFKTSKKGLESADDVNESKVIENALAAFIHVEEKDEEQPGAVATKMIKQIKWAAKKNETDRIILHSFAHLSNSKAEPELTKSTLDRAETSLLKSGYEVFKTPVGYFLDLDISASGNSLSRLFKEF